MKIAIQKLRGLKKRPVAKIKRLCRLGYLKILRLDDPPEKIAQGAALGAFIGLMPTLGVGILLCIICSFILRLNKMSAIIGSFVMNPLTTPIVWSLSMTIGGLIFWQDTASLVSHGTSAEVLSNPLGTVSIAFITGNTILASIGAAIVYIITKKAVIKHRARKAAKRGMYIVRDDENKAA
jgi:uncharacterized protein (DUF2062 family)